MNSYRNVAQFFSCIFWWVRMLILFNKKFCAWIVVFNRTISFFFCASMPRLYTRCPKKKYTAQNSYNIQTTNDSAMEQRQIDRWYFNLKFAPQLSFEGSSKCGKNVNLRLGQYCRCWSANASHLSSEIS